MQALDGQAHKHRKEMFMSIMSPAELNRLTDITKKQWGLAATKWEGTDKVVLYEETKEILCRTACEWAGVPVQEGEIKNLTSYLGSMFESAGALDQSIGQEEMHEIMQKNG